VNELLQSPAPAPGPSPLTFPALRCSLKSYSRSVALPSPLPHRPSPPPRPSGGERVFADDVGRLWSAALHAPLPMPRYATPRAAAALVFACISDAREPLRAIAVDAVVRVADAADEALRGWLREAPAMGLLT
jgi:hypothetical protein